jgi:hypothetical protein
LIQLKLSLINLQEEVKDLVLLRCQMMMKPQMIELNGATVQGRAIVVNKSEPKPEGERRSFNNNRWRRLVVVYGGNSRGDNRGGETEEDINILFINYKKRYQCKLIPFFCFYHIYKSCKLT